MQKEVERQKRAEWKRRQQLQKMQVPKTPEPVEGRKHIDVQTESYLEELVDRLVEVDVDTQTDAFVDRPPSPLFIPTKSGVDSETQIYDGELFDFDFEVEPILEVVVGKTLEQSLMEVMEEEELANMRAHQEEFVQMRAAEMAEAQRMEEAERRRYEEKERRAAQERERVEQQRRLGERIAARAYARSYVGGVMGGVFDGLARDGFFYDPLLKEINDDFLPWLLKGVDANLNEQYAARQLLDSVVAGAVQLGPAALDARVAELVALEESRLAALRAADAEAEGKDAKQAAIDEAIAAEKAAAKAEREARKVAWEAEQKRLEEERLKAEEEERLRAEAEAAAAEGDGADA